MPKAKSQAQAALFGLIASGKRPRAGAGKGMTQMEAKDRLRGVKVKELPEHAKAKRGKKKPPKSRSKKRR